MSGLYENAKSATEKLIDALVYGLKQIKTDAGYDYTIQNVWTEIPTQSQLVNYPSVAVIQGKEATDWDETEALVNTLPITLIVFMKDQSNPTSARLKLKKDIHRHFGLNWMVRGEDGVETCRLMRPVAYEPFGMFLNVPNIGFLMELKAIYNQDVNDPTVTV
jgi:hypothetical protein